MKWIIGEHFLRGRVAIQIHDDDDISKIKRNVLANIDVIDIVSTDGGLKEEWLGES